MTLFLFYNWANEKSLDSQESLFDNDQIPREEITGLVTINQAIEYEVAAIDEVKAALDLL